MKGFKKLIIGLCLITAAVAATGLTACGGNSSDSSSQSELYGTFTYQETLGLGNTSLKITNDGSRVIKNREYIYSTVYPLNHNCEGTPISYNMDQRLKLNRDYTYKYDYTITLSNPGDWGANFARIIVSVTGTFDYRPAESGKYNVLLNNPTGGTQTVYASSIGSQSIWNWSMHNQPDMVTDYSAAALVEGYEYDKYVCARMAVVNKADKTLKDNIFYVDILDYISNYSTY